VKTLQQSMRKEFLCMPFPIELSSMTPTVCSVVMCYLELFFWVAFVATADPSRYDIRSRLANGTTVLPKQGLDDDFGIYHSIGTCGTCTTTIMIKQERYRWHSFHRIEYNSRLHAVSYFTCVFVASNCNFLMVTLQKYQIYFRKSTILSLCSQPICM